MPGILIPFGYLAPNALQRLDTLMACGRRFLMPFFEVTFENVTVQRYQAPNKTQLKAALGNVEFSATEVRRCQKCRKSDACSEQDLKDLLLSAFVGG